LGRPGFELVMWEGKQAKRLTTSDVQDAWDGKEFVGVFDFAGDAALGDGREVVAEVEGRGEVGVGDHVVCRLSRVNNLRS